MASTIGDEGLSGPALGGSIAWPCFGVISPFAPLALYGRGYRAFHGCPMSKFGSAPRLGTNFCVRPYWLSPPYKLPFESTVIECTSRYPSGNSLGTFHVYRWLPLKSILMNLSG